MIIRNIKLRSGEEILCEVEEKENSYNMKNPCVLVPSGQTGIAMAPWMPFTDFKNEGIEIPKDAVLVVVKVIDEIETQYESQFGSGLIKPNSKIVTPNDLKLTT
ncbi:MAG: hypothetical protein HN962_02380 [Actinobacteria bacterium]|jgi:hypothetical protein|nr:hypothetical protein [Actinomycetota bacterium]